MNAKVLSASEIEFYWTNGYVCIADAISARQLAALRIDFAAWVDESRYHSKAYGETLANRPRFDLEVGHSAD
ncbi:MAG: phytanoyl-CoA dioxygenase family protein, partial [Actinobacteria bacterium]|nr:phytanoyl-CoA dioxygenase family protein [Actinomycetota bacterium]